MKCPTHRSILIIVLLLWCTISFGQKLRYEVYLFGNKIGETTIERKDSAGLKHYLLRSSTDAKVLFVEKKSDMSTDAFYDSKGNLFASFFQNVKNEEKFLTKVFWDTDKLIVNKDGEKKVVPITVNFSSLLLYFSEPHNMQKVFSERLGEFFELVKQADGTYSGKLGETTSTYTYRNGKLVQLEMSKGSLGSVFLKLVQ